MSRAQVVAHALRAVILATALAGAAACAAARDPHSMARWERFDWGRALVDSTELAALPLQTLERMRATIFGRHGRIFDRDSALQTYLQSRKWYRPDSAFANSALNETERRNLFHIRMAEAAKHPHVEPGDMRYWRTRVLTSNRLRKYTTEEWEILLEEVEAIHGKPIPVYAADDFAESDTSYLWRYFHERYWYFEDRAYGPHRLTMLERANLDTLRAAQLRQDERHLRPGVMGLLASTPITAEMLQFTSLYELRLLRNEIYARRGRPFRTPWIAEYFRREDWYRPRVDFSEAELTPVERANIATILAVEASRHEQLSTTELDESDVEGLWQEDARLLRNEIYARHGRVFKDPRLQAYFASLPWYKPDPNFRDSSLTAVERRNVEMILAQEQRAATGYRFLPSG